MKFSIIAVTLATSLVSGIMGHPVAPYVETKQLESPEIAKNDTMKPTWRTIWKRDDPSITDSKNNTMKPTWRTIWKRDDPSITDSKNNTMKPTWRTIWKREDPSITDSKNNTMKPTWRTIWKRGDASPTIDSKNNTMKPTWRTIWKRGDASPTIDSKNSTMKPTWHNIWKREHASSPGMMRHQAFFNAAPNATAPNAGIKHLKSSKAGKNNTMKPTWRLVSKREQHTTRLY
ncbi:hypothetical protein BZA77DRAFT_372831 [Pyronema omphalodes]|nr:hypothetical protein BZA77DRAFT_372831 [Pyronema omphalodes]